MAPYDSDSSGGEDEDFTETNVLLGYASTDANGEEVSRLGGRPDWLDPSKPPSAALARCKVCKDLMVLLLQLNGELPDRFPGHERRLYVLACKRKSCRRKQGSTRAIRGVRVSPEAQTIPATKETQPKESAPPKAASNGLGEALFGVKPAAGAGTAPRANPFASPRATTSSTNPFAPKPSSVAASAPANPFAPSSLAPKPETESSDPDAATTTLSKTFAEALSLNNTNSQPPDNSSSSTTTHGPVPPPESWPAESAQPTPYPVRWLADAEYETLDPTPPPSTSTTEATIDLDDPGEGGSGRGGEDKDVFESSMDATFQRFADRVGQNPEQCIRYEFGGAPLLYAKGDAVGQMLGVIGSSSEGGKAGTKNGGGGGMPRCGNCGANRVFEVQLMPHAIQELEAEEEGMEGTDWGTIIVGVCERDCQERGVREGGAGYLEEWAGVQWEELTIKK